MIFVTLGTQDKGFPRLLEAIEEAIEIIRMWLGTEFKGGRYQERIEMINKIEKENMK